MRCRITLAAVLLGTSLTLVSWPVAAVRVVEDDPMMAEGDEGGMMMSGAEGDADDTAIEPEALKFFESKIRPILAEHCYSCHSVEAERLRGNLALDTREGWLVGAGGGPVIIPGDVEGSALIRAVRWNDDVAMPPKRKLPDEAIRDLERWVAMGAPDPRHAEREAIETPASVMDIEAGRNHWAFQKPIKPEVPSVADQTWPLGVIDRFLLADLEAHDLKPARDADRAALIRRLSFDLTGLPPTPEAIRAFEKDRAPDAYEKVVDQLLAGTAYGERWGRHWLDVARYAESSGRESNVLYPHAWRYRDYVIDSFTQDKPYDEFLEEQLAGDLLPSGSERERAEHLIATGFLAIGTKAHNTRPAQQFALDVIDEQIDATTQAMLGLTVACARCHDHKFDPIPTRDYYAMAGIFMSSQTLFGTVRGPQNNYATGLIDLPEDAGVASGPSLPPLRRTALERQAERAKSEIERLQTQQQSGNRDAAQNVGVRLRAARSQLEIVEQTLARYDASGAPLDSSRVAMGVADAARPRNARILVRGELDKPGEEVPRGFVQVLCDEDSPKIRDGSGRLELARWIADEDNPLTARVMVNRIWLHLMGAGIVPTPDNFGLSGEMPTHPALLDWLAVRFVEEGWSVKSMVREIVLSRAYQMSTDHHARHDDRDPDNKWYWRANRKRLEGEAIRDAMLAAAGTLDSKRPAGSDIATMEGGTRLLERTGDVLGAPAPAPVRSVYLPIVRDLVPESLEVFDFAEPAFVTSDRAETNVPTQALYLLNDEGVFAIALAMADRLGAMPGDDPDRIEQAFLLALGRKPRSSEVSAIREFFGDFGDALAQAPAGSVAESRPAAGAGRGQFRERLRQQRERAAGARGRGAGSAAEQNIEPRRLAWASFCQSLFASAEFRYLD